MDNESARQMREHYSSAERHLHKLRELSTHAVKAAARERELQRATSRLHTATPDASRANAGGDVPANT